MKETGPGDAKKSLSFGYSVARIKGFTPDPRISVRDLVANQDLANKKDLGEEAIENVSAKIKLETAALSSMFIPQVWQKVHKWISENPPGIAVPIRNSKVLQPMPVEGFNNLARHADSNQSLNLIRKHTELILLVLAKEWEAEQEEKLRQIDSADPKDIRMIEAYRRYKKMLGRGVSNVVDQKTQEPTESTGDHIIGGLATGRAMIFQSFGVLEEVFLRQYGRRPTAEELKKLIQGTKSLILAIAQTDLQTFSELEDEITKPKDARLSYMDNGFDPEKFSISAQGSNFCLEIKPEILDKVEKRLVTRGHDPLHTGCPALFTKGEEGKNVITELHDWFSKLYEEFYINKI